MEYNDLRNILNKLLSIFLLLSVFLLHGTDKNDQNKIITPKTKSHKLKTLLEEAGSKTIFSGNRLIRIGKEIISIADNVKDQKSKIIGLQTLAKGYSSNGNNKKSISLLFQSRELARQINDPKGEANANSELGNQLYFSFNDFKRTITYYQKALDIYVKIKDKYDAIRIRNNLAEVYLKVGRYLEAIKLYTLALEQLENLDKPYAYSKMVVLGNLIDITCQIGNLKITKEYIDKYEEILDLNYNQNRLLKLYILKSKYFERKKKYDKALDWINKALDFQKKTSNKSSSLAKARVKMGILICKLGILLKKNILKQVELNLLKLKQLLSVFPDSFTKTGYLLIQSEYYYRCGDTKSAIIFGKKNELLCKKNNFFRELEKIYSKLSIWYLELGQKNLSLKYHRKKSSINEEKLIYELPANIMEIILKYEQKKLSNEIIMVKKTNLHTRILMIFIIIFLVSVFIYIMQKLKRKSTDKLKDMERNHIDQLTALKRQLENHAKRGNKKEEKNESFNAEYIMQRILRIIEKENLYLNTNLDLDHLEKVLKINRKYLSNAINTCWGSNFNALINSYRVKEAKKLLTDPKEEKLTSIQIAFKAGFNSKSSFNRIFKENVKMTPKRYREIFFESDVNKLKK